MSTQFYKLRKLLKYFGIGIPKPVYKSKYTIRSRRLTVGTIPRLNPLATGGVYLELEGSVHLRF